MINQKNRGYKWWIRDLLELGILLAIILFIIVIYIPKEIWNEEDTIRKESQFRMENVYNVLSFYQRLVGKATDNGLWALKVVNAVRDSLTADSTFIGNQKVILGGKEVEVNIYKNYSVAYDTAFGFLKTRKDTLMDTVFTVISRNEEQNTLDTNYIRLDMITPFLQDTSFIEIADTVISSHVEIVSYYDSYMPDSTMFFCPLTNLPYRIEVTDESIKVESPIEGTYKEKRYWVFIFKSKSHGSIDNGNRSWERF